MAVIMLGVSLLGPTPVSVAAQTAPAAQCNNDAASNVGGQGIACTVSITNYLVVSGTGTVAVAAPSSVTMTRCVGAAGPVASGAGTCATTTVASAAAISVVRQCNGSGNGGGGVVICTTTVSNVFSGSALTPAPATIYQCVGSVITGTGAPGSCTPANTAGVTSVPAATVGQCNGSGNGGTSVGFTCSVSGGSTVTAAFPVNIDQCNGSANGGGALTTCSASITTQFAGPVATPAATATTTATPTPTPSATPTPSSTVTPTPSSTPLVAAIPTVTATPSTTPGTTTSVVPPGGGIYPTPADTGNAGPMERSRTSLMVALAAGLTASALVVLGRQLMLSRRRA